MKIRRTYMALAGALALIMHSVQASASAPATSLLTAPLVTPASAFSFYGTATTHSVGLSLASTRSPQIKALARALSRGGAISGDVLAQRVASYVRSNIRVEFRFGLGKGARGAVIDQSGTPFDQADTMVQILREAGATANFQLGTITLTPTQFGKWSGLVTGLNESAQTFNVNAQAACQFLADGGIPAIVNGAASCTGLTGNLTSVTLAHVWVITGGKAYDPSFKQYTLKAGIDIASGMGCGNDASPTCGAQVDAAALLGASQGTAYGAPYIQNLNRSQLEATIAGYATALQPVIQALGADALIESVTGGMIADDTYAPTASATLPYQAGTQTIWSGDIPDQFRTTLQVSCYGASQAFFADEISGSRIWLNASAAGNTMNRTGSIVIEGVNVSSSSTAVANVNPYYVYGFNAILPYAANSGGYGDLSFSANGGLDTRIQDNTYSGSVENQSYVVFQLGSADVGQETYYNGMLGVYPDILDIGFGDWVVSASRWLTQASQAQNIIQNVAKANITPHVSVGIAFAQSIAVLNVESTFSVNDRNANTSNRLAAFQAAAAANAVLEGSVRQQAQDAVDSDTSASWFRLANDKGYQFFAVNSSNISNVLANSSNYSSDRQGLLINYVSDGLNLIIPINGAIGSVSYGPQVPMTLPMGPDYGFDSTRAAYLIADRYKGGASVAGLDPLQGAVQSLAVETGSLKSKEKLAIDASSGIFNFQPSPDLTLGSGDLGLSLQRVYSSNINSLINCQFILSDPAGSEDCEPILNKYEKRMDAGWDYSFRYDADWGSNATEAFGYTNALRATYSIAAIKVIIDLNDIQSISRYMDTLLASDFWARQFVHNSLTLSSASQSGSFLKLPNGSYDSPASERGGSVVEAGSIGGPYTATDNGGSAIYDYNPTSWTFITRNGSVIYFKPMFCNDYVSATYCQSNSHYGYIYYNYPSGIRRNGVYSANSFNVLGNLIGVSNSVGYIFNINLSIPGHYSAYLNANISDNNGSSVNYGCSTEEALQNATINGVAGPSLYGFNDDCTGFLTSTDASGNVSRATYVLRNDPSQFSNRLGPIQALYLPNGGTTTPFYQFGYDNVAHVATVTDANSHVTTVYTASVSSERSRLGETVAPDGGVTSTLFNQHGKPLVVTDPLGRQTTNSYDTADRLLRTVNPAGGAIEYQYDVRGNMLRECHIASTASPAGRGCDTTQDMVTTTTYVEGPTVWTCANASVCNRPLTITDPKGIVTQYSWSTVHGQLLTEAKGFNSSGVCQLSGGACPLTTLGYTAFTGVDGATFYLLTSRTEQIDAAHSTTTTYTYNPSNHWTLWSAVEDSGGLRLQTCFKFDSIGNLISKTAPNANLASCP